MPKHNCDYSKTLIYKIVCNDLNITDCYIGSTTEFTKRKNCHKTVCNNTNNLKYNFYVYQFIRENGGWNNWPMIEIEKYPCNDSNEAKARERYWYEQLDPSLNKQKPFRLPKESEHDYYNRNKELILTKNKVKTLCACGSKYNCGNKTQHVNSKKHIDYYNSLEV